MFFNKFVLLNLLLLFPSFEKGRNHTVESFTPTFGHVRSTRVHLSQHSVVEGFEDHLGLVDDFSNEVCNTTLARAALYSYNEKHQIPERFSLCNVKEEDGFKAVTLCHQENNITIISFRGTQSLEDIYFDFSLLFNNNNNLFEFMRLSFKKLGLFQDSFLYETMELGERALDVPILKNNNNEQIKQAHRNLRKNLMKKWRSFKKNNLSSEKFAGLFFEKRIDLLRQYVELELSKHELQNHTVYVVGHSLGGLYAQLASLMFNLPGASFNSPGVNKVFKSCRNFFFHEEADNNDRFINHRQKNDLVSLLEHGNHHGRIVVYDQFFMNPITAHSLINIFSHL